MLSRHKPKVAHPLCQHILILILILILTPIPIPILIPIPIPILILILIRIFILILILIHILILMHKTTLMPVGVVVCDRFSLPSVPVMSTSPFPASASPFQPDSLSSAFASPAYLLTLPPSLCAGPPIHSSTFSSASPAPKLRPVYRLPLTCSVASSPQPPPHLPAITPIFSLLPHPHLPC